MKFSHIKNDIIVPKKQLVIDKKVLVNDKMFHVLSAYEQCDKVMLVTLNIGDKEDESDAIIEFDAVKTNRDELLSMHNTHTDSHLSVKELYLDEKKIECDSSSGGLYENHYDFFKLSYIANLGIDLDYLDDVLLANIIVTTFEMHEATLDDLNLDKARKLRITRIPSFENVLANVECNLTLSSGDFSFIDESSKEHKFRARLREIDIWSEVVPKVEENFLKFYESLDEKEKELHQIDEFYSTYENICPRGKNLLCVAYESEEQLDFYTKEFLDANIVRNTHGSFMFLGRDDETNERFSILNPVKKGEVEEVEVELFRWIKYTEVDDIVVHLQ